MENRPQGRQKNITGQGKSVSRRGSGQGTGPVGSSGGFSGRTNRPSGSEGYGTTRSTGKRSGGSSLLSIVAALVVLLGGGSVGINALTGGSDAGTAYTQTTQAYTTPAPTAQQSSGYGSYESLLESLFGSSAYTSTGSSASGSSAYGNQSSSNLLQGFDYSSLFGSSSYTGSGSSASGSSTATQGSVLNAPSYSWQKNSNNGKLDSTVAKGTRDRYTTIKGSGKDTVTLMVYMCGTDLESKSGMATRDLQEMLAANLTDSVNVIVYTGGCSQWRNNVISSSVNQIYKLEKGGLRCLSDNAGTTSMTDPKTLSSFITFCSKNYPANRNMLILWDHGGGSISGYGYDEKNSRSGAMNLAGLNEALANGRTRFDFIGFDACLMSTLETGLTMASYADYLIASEETEPGLGWYYTDWLTALCSNPSISTLELGKRICDDFVDTCARRVAGQKTTLALIDLAELENTVPADFKDFSASTLALIKNDGYQTVVNARSNTREFSVSSKLDQIDLVDLALRLDTEESRALADSILGAVKYNRVSAGMTSAYGVSLYFPYQKLNRVNTAISTYDAIGLDDTYSDCIRAFASLEVSGQAAAGTVSNPVSVLNSGSATSGTSAVGNDMLSALLSQMLTGGSSYSGSSGYFDRSLDIDSTAVYLAQNRFDASALIWQYKDGVPVLSLSEDQWALVKTLELNLFVDDGEGYLDLGLDNVFDFTTAGDLVGLFDGTWLAIDSQPVAYYQLDTTVTEDGYSITGRVPVLLNNVRADLILVFDTENPYGYIAGARTDYRAGETDTVAKALTELEPGDTIDFLCDYYTYDGSYEDTYFIGEQVTYTGSEVISNVYLSEPGIATYRLTDIYNNTYWTPELP